MKQPTKINGTSMDYEKSLEKLLNGIDRPMRLDRTGVGTYADFGCTMTYQLDGKWDDAGQNLNVFLPLITTKKVPYNVVLAELLWFLSGSTNNNDLRALGATIWDEWAGEDGELGKIYGYQWRSWDGKIDQIANVLKSLREDPFGRRHIVTAWNPTDIENGDLALPPCHMLMQFFVGAVGEDGRPTLSLQVYQRSADIFLGVPFNLASYGTLLTMVAASLDMTPHELKWVGGDVHLYSNHVDQASKQVARYYQLMKKRADPPYRIMGGIKEEYIPEDVEMGLRLPQLTIPKKDLLEYEMGDFELLDYNPYPTLKGDVAV